MSDWKDVRVWTRDEMMKRVARFKDLKGSDGGLPDSDVPECHRDADRRDRLPAARGVQRGDHLAGRRRRVGDAGDRHPGGLQPRLLPGQAGQGPADAQPRHQRDLHSDDRQAGAASGTRAPTRRASTSIRFDVISFPVGVARRFMNVTYDEPDKEHLLMFVIGGNEPQAEFTPLAMQRVRAVAEGKGEDRGLTRALVSPAACRPRPRADARRARRSARAACGRRARRSAHGTRCGRRAS